MDELRKQVDEEKVKRLKKIIVMKEYKYTPTNI